MSKYVIPNADRLTILANTNRPARHGFWYEDDGVYYYNDNTTQYLDFDYDAVFQTEFTKTLTEYLSSLGRKAKLKASTYVSEFANIKDVDYNLMWLKKERIFNKGELEQVNYWAEYDVSTKTYSDLVIKEEITYNRDIGWYIQDRDKVISWMGDDESIVDTKITKKFYTPVEAAKAGEKKRANIISEVKVNVIGMIAATEAITVAEAEVLGMAFVEPLEIYMGNYIRGVTQPFIDAVTNTDLVAFPWMGNVINPDPVTTIQQYVLSEIDY